MARVLSLVGFAFVLFAVESQAGEIPPSLRTIAAAIRHSCLEVTGADVALIEDASNGNFAEDEKLKCYMKCVYQKFSLFNDDKIDFELLTMLIPPEMVESGMKMINGCREITGKDLCDLAYKTTKCFYEQVPEDFFVI